MSTTQRFSLAVRLVSRLRLGACLVTRPRPAVVHVYDGPLTPAGFVPARSRAVCGTRTRRLAVLPDGITGLGPHRRLCRRCQPLLAAWPAGSPFLAGRLVNRDAMAAAFAHLTLADLEHAARWSRTVAETHEVAVLMSLLLGPTPRRPVTEDQRRHRQLEDALLKRRRRLRTAELSPEERADIVARREAEVQEQIRINLARQRQARIDVATDKAIRGQYLMPSQRDLLDEVAAVPTLPRS